MAKRSIVIRLDRDVEGFSEGMLKAHLSILCSAAGLLDSDRDTAIRAYVDHGPMHEADRDLMASMNQAARDAYMATRWGSDGSRVASIAWAAEVA